MTKLLVFILFISCYSFSFYLIQKQSSKSINVTVPKVAQKLLVPNYVHFIRFNRPVLKFAESVCILAALKHQKPDKLFIHTNVKPKGKYWKIIKSLPGLNQILKFKYIELPSTIYGQKLNANWRVYHGSDITRLSVLMEFGGIYLDSDSYIVKSLDFFRQFEITLGWIPNKSLQNQVVVAHKDARFLKLWLESYRDNYVSNLWYYNAGQLPTKLLEKNSSLIYNARRLFGGYGVFRKIFLQKWPEWRDYYALHTQFNHVHEIVEGNFPESFNETNIHKYPVAFRDMAYDVFPFKMMNISINNKTVNF